MSKESKGNFLVKQVSEALIRFSNLLLKYGADSESVREAFAPVIRRIANTDVEGRYSNIKSKKTDRFGQMSGVHLVRNGEVFDRLFAKVMVLVTADDIKEHVVLIYCVLISILVVVFLHRIFGEYYSKHKKYYKMIRMV